MDKNIIIFLISISLHLNGTELEQTSWIKETAQGFTIENGELETTEGFGAYLDYCLKPNTKNFDNGGGTHDYNTIYLKRYHGVTNSVYDPFQRSVEHNETVLAEVENHDFDTATSNSVLNVIDTKESRLQHIALSCRALKEGGIAYFKVYPGNSSLVGNYTAGGYQSNRPAKTYQDEIEAMFGKGNVVVDTMRHLIIAYKNSNCGQLPK